MQEPIPAAIAFFAMGAVLLSSVLLLLLNPQSRPLWAYLLFQAGLVAWLGVQGWAFAAGSWTRIGPVVQFIVDLLPALFLTYLAVQVGFARGYRVAVLVAIGVAVALGLRALSGLELGGPARILWHVSSWGTASVLQLSFLRRRSPAAAEGSPRRRLQIVLSSLFFAIAPVVLLGSILFGVSVFHYGMPLLLVWVQVLVFIGVIHLRFYDVEVRVAHAGELVTSGREAERSALVGELTASLAHEIRNPLTGVRSLAQRLAEEEIDEERRRRYASVILEETGRVERLVANLLTITKRIHAPRPEAEEVSIGALLDDLLLLLGSRAAKAGVSLALQRSDLTVRCRREALTQVLLNVVLNAIQHSPPGATVRLLSEAHRGGVLIRTRDQGSGIPEGERERIWEPFHSTAGGSGLGLAIVRRIAREEGWEVAVESAPDGGTDFLVRIPRVASQPPAVEEKAAGAGRGAR